MLQHQNISEFPPSPPGWAILRLSNIMSGPARSLLYTTRPQVVQALFKCCRQVTLVFSEYLVKIGKLFMYFVQHLRHKLHSYYKWKVSSKRMKLLCQLYLKISFQQTHCQAKQFYPPISHVQYLGKAIVALIYLRQTNAK